MQNQAINNEYNNLNISVSKMKSQLEKAVLRATASEQRVSSLTVERDDLLMTYRGVCSERSRLDEHVANIVYVKWTVP